LQTEIVSFEIDHDCSLLLLLLLGGFFVSFTLRHYIRISGKRVEASCVGLQPRAAWHLPRLLLVEHLEARFQHGHEIPGLCGWCRTGIEDQRILSPARPVRVIAVEQPLSGVDGNFLIRHRRRHVDAVGDTVRIGDDEELVDRCRPQLRENDLSVCSSLAPMATLAT